MIAWAVEYPFLTVLVLVAAIDAVRDVIVAWRGASS